MLYIHNGKVTNFLVILQRELSYMNYETLKKKQLKRKFQLHIALWKLVIEQSYYFLIGEVRTPLD